VSPLRGFLRGAGLLMCRRQRRTSSRIREFFWGPVKLFRRPHASRSGFFASSYRSSFTRDGPWNDMKCAAGQGSRDARAAFSLARVRATGLAPDNNEAR